MGKQKSDWIYCVIRLKFVTLQKIFAMKKIACILALILCVNSYANAPFFRWLEINQLVRQDSLDLPISFANGKCCEAFMQFFKENINYPTAVSERGARGVWTWFSVLNEDGIISDIRIQECFGLGCRDEIHRVMSLMQLAPGTIDGVPQRIGLFTSIGFKPSDSGVVMLPIGDRETDRLFRSRPEEVTRAREQNRRRISYTRWLEINNLTHPDSLDIQPQFPGGEEALLKFLNENIEQPEVIVRTQGIAHIMYVVEQDGSASNVTVNTPIGDEFSGNLIATIAKMPKWLPGTINEQPKDVGLQMWLGFYFSDTLVEITPLLDTIARNRYMAEHYVEPKFPDGIEALHRFLQNNIRFPRESRQRGIQGTVFVTFVVERDGSISNVEVLRGIGGGADEEAIRVVSIMPRWIPGEQRRRPVRVQFNMPIRFTQAEGNSQNRQHQNIHERNQQRNRQEVNRRGSWNNR